MKIIVFDDDPTGSQTVHDCLLLLNWDYKNLLNALKSNNNIFFVLANTRSLSEEEVEIRLKDICNSLKNVITNEGFNKKDFLFISRGDSTLRGHNFLEPDIINNILGPFDATFHIPAFLEGNRITKNGIHYVNDLPAHKTIFAKDKIFGYQTSDIKTLLIKKSKHKIAIEKIHNLTHKDLDSLESYENDKLYKRLINLEDNTHVIVDTISYPQLKRFCSTVKEILPKKSFLFRTAASFISAISDIQHNYKNGKYYSQLRRKNQFEQPLNGLIVVGSYVPIATVQLKKILENKECRPLEINVFEFYKILQIPDNNGMETLKKDLLKQIRNYLKNSYTPIIYTSRDLMYFDDEKKQIKFFNILALFIAKLISEIKLEIGYLISKGGITTNTILSKSLGVNYVYLEGQILSGISLVSAELENVPHPLPIVTFPGNIGDENSLVKVWQTMENKV
tara:strand:+ start:2856 stop:4205 length:1350 start_codon:yes stop_codon:yes gene_type:complete